MNSAKEKKEHRNGDMKNWKPSLKVRGREPWSYVTGAARVQH